MPTIRKGDEAEFIGQMIDIFEDFLKEKGVDIPNPDREEEDTQACIFSDDYDKIADGLRTTLKSWKVLESDDSLVTRNKILKEISFLVNLVDCVEDQTSRIREMIARTGNDRVYDTNIFDFIKDSAMKDPDLIMKELAKDNLLNGIPEGNPEEKYPTVGLGSKGGPESCNI